MNRREKEQAISSAKELISASQAVFVVNYKGLSVAKMQTLRSSIRQNGGQLKVIKASLMDIAAKDLDGVDEFKSSFKDQIGFVFAKGDVSAVAKQLIDFSKENESLKVLTGVFESKVLSSSQINVIASLPSREVLIAQVLGTMQAPIASFVRVLNQVVASLPQVIKQIEEKKASGN